MVLTNQLKREKQYISGLWHHDRCGNRLKAFLYLNDVLSDDSRPTEIAVGSHNTHWYSHHISHETRYSDDYVRREYKVASMKGPKGGGFIFDTNSLHRGVVKGTKERLVVILEFNPKYKSVNLNKLQAAFPCPSQKIHPIDVYLNPELERKRQEKAARKKERDAAAAASGGH